MSVIIETTVGDITVDLFTEERPRTCMNFLKLCKVKYYNFCLFHKIQHNFIAQAGDPTGTGRGGESIFSRLYGDQARFFEAEVKPRLKHRKEGTLSMVNNGDNLHGSQFFLTLGEDLDYLDGVHTVFGEVAEGLDVLMKINDVICDEEHRPYQDVLITHTVILDDPYDDPKGLEVPSQSPEPTPEQLQSHRIGADEEIDDTKGKSLEEIEESIKDKEAKAHATILEMVGDIPDVDVKPPEHVLFVCKLNPVTTAEDLEIIFSRFGPIKSCEVIKDRKTGESLQYAFIEFENADDCENAYFKMDNVLIDDRRIHVDFSQSVAKVNWLKEKNQRGKAEQQAKKYAVKAKAGQRKDSRYDLVFEDTVTTSGKEHSRESSNDRKKEKRHKDKLFQPPVLQTEKCDKQGFASTDSSEGSPHEHDKVSKSRQKEEYKKQDHHMRHHHHHTKKKKRRKTSSGSNSSIDESVKKRRHHHKHKSKR